METGACYMISCRTGCTCCSSENHIRGPFSSMVVAEQAIVQYKKLPLLASQYARTGMYRIEAASYEQLPDGRLIINDDRVSKGFVDSDPLGDNAVYDHTGY